MYTNARSHARVSGILSELFVQAMYTNARSHVRVSGMLSELFVQAMYTNERSHVRVSGMLSELYRLCTQMKEVMLESVVCLVNSTGYVHKCKRSC